MKIEYISGYKFARMSDYVFSEVLTNKQFKEVNPKNIEIIYSNNSHVCYQKNQLDISDGDTVFFNEKWPDVTMDNAPTTNFTEYTRVTPKKGRAVIFDGTRFHSAYRSKKQHRVVINTNASVL